MEGLANNIGQLSDTQHQGIISTCLLLKSGSVCNSFHFCLACAWILNDCISVTGSSSGFGRSMVEYVLSKGDIAVATLRKPDVLDDLKAKFPASQLLILKLDVTQPQDIADAFAKTKEVFGRIDVVFNNAGYAIVTEVEATPEDVARSMFEVTFWGAERVSREAVKFFREVNKPGFGGRLLNNSSMAGLNAFPALGHYSAAKHGERCLFGSLLRFELRVSYSVGGTISITCFGA